MEPLQPRASRDDGAEHVLRTTVVSDASAAPGDQPPSPITDGVADVNAASGTGARTAASEASGAAACAGGAGGCSADCGCSTLEGASLGLESTSPAAHAAMIEQVLAGIAEAGRCTCSHAPARAYRGLLAAARGACGHAVYFTVLQPRVAVLQPRV